MNSLFLHLQMDTQQPDIAEQKVESVTVERVIVSESNENVKVEKIAKVPVSIIPIVSSHEQPTSLVQTSVPESIVTSPQNLQTTTVIATKQRMITTQGHIREIPVSQAHEVQEHYEQYQITASGDDQNVYTYESSPGGIITINQPENLQTGILTKRDILIEKEHPGISGPTINVVSAEPQTVYVELKNNGEEQARYITNPAIRYEAPERYHRFAYHGIPPHNPHIQHQRDISLKSEQSHHPPQPPQELQIYEAEHAAPNHSQQQPSEQNAISSEQSNEPKAHYTNLETVTSSQSSYYLTESYQPSNSNSFAYLPTTTAKEGSYIYHPSSPVLYKSK